MGIVSEKEIYTAKGLIDNMEKYTTVSLPEKLHKNMITFIKERPELGYGSVAEFAKEAIRARIVVLREEVKVMISSRLKSLSPKSWEETWEDFRDSCKS